MIAGVLALVSLLGLPSLAGGLQNPDSFAAKVVRVLDGDSLVVARGREWVEIRLHGIDCPEAGQEFSGRARDFTSDMVLGREVTVAPVELDQHGRTVGRVRLGEKDISVELVRAGLGWHYVRYAPDDQELASAESLARKEARGLWGQKDPTPPWEWRRDLGRELLRGNTKSLVYHRPGCRNYACENCSRTFASRAEAESSGFRPCRTCLP